MNRVLFILSFICISLFSTGQVVEQHDSLKHDSLKHDALSKDKALVYRFSMRRNIGPAIWRQTKQAFEEAREMKADYFIIHMNTYGGAVVQADSIRTIILNSKIPVYVFVDNNAASAGALIAIACDKIFMRKGASIGAATVVDMSGQAMPDKYQSYMRSTMRSTAEAQGKDTTIVAGDTIVKWKRDPRIAEAMVDERIAIKGIVDTGQVLTLTPTEAMEIGFCDYIAEDIEEVISIAGIENYELAEYRATALESVIGFLVNPFVQGILIMMIIGGIYFEMQTPGVGFPIAAAIFAAVIYFAPLYLEGLAENYEILIFILGVVLIMLEIFVIPGFGIAGISGIILVISGMVLSMVDNLGFKLDEMLVMALMRALALVVTSMVISLIGSIAVSRKLFGSRKLAFALNTEENVSEGYIGVEASVSEVVGRIGIAYTVLRPSGKVMIDDEIYDATTVDGAFIDKGTTVKVVKYLTGQVFVEKV